MRKAEQSRLGEKVKQEKNYQVHRTPKAVNAGIHTVDVVRKTTDNKMKNRYLKSYNTVENRQYINVLESAASDLYELLLGRGRAARSRVVEGRGVVSTSLPDDYVPFDQHVESILPPSLLYTTVLPGLQIQSRKKSIRELYQSPIYCEHVIKDMSLHKFGSAMAASYLLGEADLHLGNVGFADGNYVRLDFDRSLEMIQLQSIIATLSSPQGGQYREEVIDYLINRYLLVDALYSEKIAEMQYLDEKNLDTKRTRTSQFLYEKRKYIKANMTREMCISFIEDYLKSIDHVKSSDLEKLSNPTGYRPFSNWVFIRADKSVWRTLYSNLAKKLNIPYNIAQNDHEELDMRSSRFSTTMSDMEMSNSPESIKFNIDKVKTIIKATLFNDQDINSIFKTHVNNENVSEFFSGLLIDRFKSVKRELLKSKFLKEFIRDHLDEIFRLISEDISEYNLSTFSKIYARIDQDKTGNYLEARKYYARLVRINIHEAKEDFKKIVNDPRDFKIGNFPRDIELLLEKSYSNPYSESSFETMFLRSANSDQVATPMVETRTPGQQTNKPAPMPTTVIHVTKALGVTPTPPANTYKKSFIQPAIAPVVDLTESIESSKATSYDSFTSTSYESVASTQQNSSDQKPSQIPTADISCLVETIGIDADSKANSTNDVKMTTMASDSSNKREDQKPETQSEITIKVSLLPEKEIFFSNVDEKKIRYIGQFRDISMHFILFQSAITALLFKLENEQSELNKTRFSESKLSEIKLYADRLKRVLDNINVMKGKVSLVENEEISKLNRNELEASLEFNTALSKKIMDISQNIDRTSEVGYIEKVYSLLENSVKTLLKMEEERPIQTKKTTSSLNMNLSIFKTVLSGIQVSMYSIHLLQYHLNELRKK